MPKVLEKSAARAASSAEPSRLTPQISICVCTYKRPALLRELLKGLLEQKTDGAFSFSVVVVDNDRLESSRATAEEFRSRFANGLRYFVEPEQSIALARNRSVAAATGDLLAFIDDDEVPASDWLYQLYRTLLSSGADGVLGPVDPRFVEQPAAWKFRAGIFDRPNESGKITGDAVHWRQTGTGNALIRRRVFEQVGTPFRSQFGSGGEDVDFFRRAAEKGSRFVWCAEARTYETVPVERTKILFQVKRALLRGRVALGQPSGKLRGVLKSMLALLVYTPMLPVFLAMGRGMFVKFLIKDCDHLGKILALLRVRVVRQRYVVK